MHRPEPPDEPPVANDIAGLRRQLGGECTCSRISDEDSTLGAVGRTNYFSNTKTAPQMSQPVRGVNSPASRKVGPERHLEVDDSDSGSSAGGQDSRRWRNGALDHGNVDSAAFEHAALGSEIVLHVRGDDLLLHYKGSYPTIDTVPLAHARWFSELAAALTSAQVRQAFEAAGASPKEIDGFSERLLERIGERRAAVGGSPRHDRDAAGTEVRIKARAPIKRS